MMFLGEISFRVTGCDSDESFEGHIDQVLEYLYLDDRVVDPDYAATLGSRRVEFSLSVDARDEIAGLEVMYGALRAAIHAASGRTPGWESSYQRVLSRIQSASLVDA